MEDMLLPPGIARTISQRSKESVSSLGSFDVDGGEKVGFERRYQNSFARAVGNETGGRGGAFGQGYRDVGDVSPLSPLPPARMRGGEGEVYVDGVGFSLVPRSPAKREEMVELQGEEMKEKVFELA
jgi:hypothetical protein